MSIPEWMQAGGAAASGAATLVVGWAGLQGLGAWRRETLGRRKAELAEEVLAQFYQARDALTWARTPAAGAALARPDSVEEDAALAAPVRRLTEESEFFSDLQASRYRFMAYFGEAAAAPFEEIRAVHGEVMAAARELMRATGEAQDAQDAGRRLAWRTVIGWDGEGGDPILARLSQAILAIEQTCRPLIDEAAHNRAPLAGLMRR